MGTNVRIFVSLLSLIIIVVPLMIFPERFGLPLISGSAIYMMYELVFYGVVLYLFRRDVTLSTILVGSALTFVYRMALGAAFGLGVIAIHNLDNTVAFSLGMAKYLPSVLLHVLAAPFIMRPVYLNLAAHLNSPEANSQRRWELVSSGEPHTDARPEYRFRTDTQPAPLPVHTPKPERRNQPAFATDDPNLFARAIDYIGESSSVRLAVLADDEGLPLASFSRCEEDIELWAPLSLVLNSSMRDLLRRYGRGGDPEKIDLSTRSVRIIIRRIQPVTLLVLGEPQADETIHIRISQATDMIRKYITDRYSPSLFVRAEGRYVPNS